MSTPLNLIVVDPFEGRGFTATWAQHGQTGEDRTTPRLYDYTAASDGTVVSAGGTYREIVVKMDNGVHWRLAEVETILVIAGNRVRRGQVIGRNAYFRKGDVFPKGAYRAPHMNGGGSGARTQFTKMVTHTKAQAAALDAAAAANDIRKRTVKASVNAVRRMGPGKKYAVAGDLLKAGTPGNFVAFAHGPASQDQPTGNDVWFKGISGHWFWSGSFTSQSTAGLVDLTAEFADVIVSPPPVVVAPPTPDPEPVLEEPVVPEPPVVTPEPEPEPPVVEPEPPVVEPEPEPEPPVVAPEPPVIEPPVTPSKPAKAAGIGLAIAAVLAVVGAWLASLFQ